MRELRKLPAGSVIIHGAHWQGADHIADEVARELGFEVRLYPAKWASWGRAAGPRRNSEMLVLEHLPGDPIEVCLAFAEDFTQAAGTKDMQRKARAAGIRVESFSS